VFAAAVGVALVLAVVCGQGVAAVITCIVLLVPALFLAYLAVRVGRDAEGVPGAAGGGIRVTADGSSTVVVAPQSPYRVRLAISQLDVRPDQAFLLGDSATYVPTGHLAGVAVIGFANKRGKAELLARARADSVTTRLSDATKALLGNYAQHQSKIATK
jgi:phosphoglycolate phosphatase-like HAD superfamily hydrolase